MPKKNSKKRGGAKAQPEGVVLPSSRPKDEDGSVDDNCSTQSVVSDDSSWQSSDPVNGDDEVLSEQENFELNFNDMLDGTLEKSSSIRERALRAIRKSLQRKYVPTFLDGRKETVADCLVKCLKKGKEEEICLAAHCMCLLCLQLGSDFEPIYTSTQPLLCTLLTDSASSFGIRAACGLCLSISSMICCDDPEIIKSIAKSLEAIFTQGYDRGEMSPGLLANHNWVICQSLIAWAFMLTYAPYHQVQKHIDEHLRIYNLPDLLQNSDVDLRIAAGQTVALMYELARENDEDFEPDDDEYLCDTLKQMSTDFMKYHGKKDRKEQRSQFRDIYSYVMEDESPVETIRLGKMNQFELNGWAQKRQYECLCTLLGTGISTHLQVNPVVREMFDLGLPGLDEYGQKRSMSKAQRTFLNAAAFKARSKARAKHRDKRSAATCGF